MLFHVIDGWWKEKVWANRVLEVSAALLGMDSYPMRCLSGSRSPGSELE